MLGTIKNNIKANYVIAIFSIRKVTTESLHKVTT